ncbi:MAG: hypothetical protein HYX56_07800, partial [Chloroflexi bacterium]|nr:hypothetical protein [Chloroflexota bacterium]
VGQGAVESIIEARRGGGPFRSLDDLCQRIDLGKINKRMLESLIKCGACDAFGPRQAMLDKLDAVLATAQREQRDRASGQVGLFDLFGTAVEATRIEGTEAPRRELLGWEKELLGIYLSDHPLQEVTARLGDVVTAYLAELKDAGDDLVVVGCVVTSARKHITKNKQLMVFAQVEDLTGSAEVTVFPRTYEATHEVWNADEILLIIARVEQRDDAPQLLCEDAVRFDDAGIRAVREKLDERRAFLARKAKYAGPRQNGDRAPANGNGNGHGARAAERPVAPAADAPPVLVRFRSAFDYERSLALFQRIQVVLGAHPGASRVALELPRRQGSPQRIPTPFRVEISDALSAEIEREVGDVVEVVVGG